MRSYADFVSAANTAPRTAHFGLVSADRLRTFFDRLDSQISALVKLMQFQTIVGNVGMIDNSNYLGFAIAWSDFYIRSRPASVFWSSDQEWQDVEIWNQDYLQWRAFYEKATGEKLPPATEPKDVPPPPDRPFLPGFPTPTISAAGGIGIGTGLTIAGLAILLVWTSGQRKG